VAVWPARTDSATSPAASARVFERDASEDTVSRRGAAASFDRKRSSSRETLLETFDDVSNPSARRVDGVRGRRGDDTLRATGIALITRVRFEPAQTR